MSPYTFLPPPRVGGGGVCVSGGHRKKILVLGVSGTPTL